MNENTGALIATILSAEKDVKETLQIARGEAEKISKDANQKAEQIRRASFDIARKNCEDIEREYLSKVKDECEQCKSTGSIQAKALKEKLEDKQIEIAKIIAKEIVDECLS